MCAHEPLWLSAACCHVLFWSPLLCTIDTSLLPQKDEVYLNLVMEYVPETIYRSLRNYVKVKQNMPPILIKLYMYQLLRSLAYIHSIGICHRDIKPQNLLLNAQTGELKLCDFGSAKILVPGEPNVSYICSRYYRAPELIFGATNYTTSIGTYALSKCPPPPLAAVATASRPPSLAATSIRPMLRCCPYSALLCCSLRVELAGLTLFSLPFTSAWQIFGPRGVSWPSSCRASRFSPVRVVLTS